MFDEVLAGADDSRILQRSCATGRVVLTHDSDFGELAVRAGRGFIGIIYLRPGHIAASSVLQLIDAIATTGIEVTPPFLVVATKTDGGVRVRFRTVRPADPAGTKE